MKIFHVFEHQDRRKTKSLTLQAQLNFRVDILISTYARKPLHTNITNTPMIVCLKNQYIPNKYYINIGSQSRSNTARNFIMNENNWYTQTYDDIE